MSFTNELPLGSIPFSNLLYKAPDGRIWAGNEFTPEFYRIVDPIDLPYINIKDFGAKGDGVTDDTAAWDEALSVAKAMEMALYFPSGQYPVTISVDTVDMNGCLGLSGSGELLFSENSDPDAALLRWTGVKELITAPISSTAGQFQWTVDPGKNIKKGDTIFIASYERMYEDSLVQPYMRGERLIVDNYNSTTGALATSDYAYYNITSGYIYHNSVRPKVIIEGVTLTLVSDPDKKGVQVDVGEVYITNAHFKNFGRFCYSSSSSLTRIINSLFDITHIPENGVGYGVISADLSDVIITASVCSSGRHGISCGGSAYWRTGDVGQTPDSHIFLPSHCRVIGSRIEGKVYALDAHAGTTILEVTNCDIFGGCILGAYENYVSNSRIRQGPAAAAVRFGRDRSETVPIYYYSTYSITKCDVYADTKAFSVNCSPKHLEVNDINVFASPSVAARTFFEFASNVRAKTFVFKGVRHIGDAADDVSYNLYIASAMEIADCSFENARLSLSIREATVRNILLKNIRIQTTEAFGMAIGASNPDHNKTFDVTASQLRVFDAGQGASIRAVRRMTISDSAFYGCGLSVFVGNTTGGDMWLTVSGSIVDQPSGTFISSQTGQTTHLVLANNQLPSVSTVGANIVVMGKYGNVGLDDKLKTALTTVTTAKYGADTTTGDLTLS